jgi:thiol-disulfide isomerase/thioredoxin
MESILPEQIEYFLWDQMDFRGHWLLPLLLALTIAVCCWWWRGSVEQRRWLTWVGFGLLAILAWAEVAGMRRVFEPSFAEYARELRRTDSYVGKQLPELEFRRVDDDESLELADFRGQVVLLNLWATWCPPCIHEMPALEELQRTHRNRGLLVVTLSNESRQQIVSFFKEHPVDTLNVYNESLAWIYNVEARPMSFIVGRDGVLLDWSEYPGDGDYASFANWVDPHLEL